MKFSIITVCRNAAARIEQALDSVARQKYTNVEHVVIDGASVDETPRIVARYRRSVNVFVSEPDSGIYNAMNKGIQRATGDYILFLNSDDYLTDDRVIGDVADHLKKIGPVDFLYGRIVVQTTANAFQQVESPAVPDILHHMICGCLPHQASFARKDLFHRIGAFNERYRVHAEYDWFLRVATTPGLNLAHYPRNVSVYHEAGLSSNLRVGQPEAYAIQNQLPVYQEEYWMRERIRIYQQCFLDLRVHVAELDRHAREWQSSKFFKLRAKWMGIKQVARRTPHRLKAKIRATAARLIRFPKRVVKRCLKAALCR